MFADELDTFADNGTLRLIQLEVYLAVLGMVVVLMPPEEETALRLNPVEPIEVVVGRGVYIKPDFEPCRLCRIFLVLQERSRVSFRDYAIGSSLSIGSNSELYGAECGTSLESVVDSTVETFVPEPVSVSEENHLHYAIGVGNHRNRKAE